MDLHVSDDELAVVARRAEDTGAVAAKVALAWHLRERDSRRALKVADQAVAQGGLSPQEVNRLRLARAEALTLLFDIGAAEFTWARAQEGFAEYADTIGLGDSCLTEIALGIATGDAGRYERGIEEAARRYRDAGDQARVRVAEAWSCYFLAYADPGAALVEAKRMSAQSPLPPAAAALVAAAEAAALFWRDPPRSVAVALRVRDLAMKTGMVRLAIIASSNAGWVLECMGDFDAALECIEWSVSRARAAGWPMVLASAETRLGSVLRALGQLDRSREILEAAVKRFEALPGGSHKAIALSAMGETMLAEGKAAAAVPWFETAARLNREARSSDNLVDSVIHLAQARSLAGDAGAALAAVAEAEELIAQHGFAERRVAVAETLAGIHQRHALPPPAGMSALTARRHFLEVALAAGRAIEGWQPTAELMIKLAEACEGEGDSKAAFRHAREALAIEQGAALRKAADRSTLMQVRHETARAEAETRHHRDLARAMTQHSQTLEQLGRIGQEITANLDDEAVFSVLSRHLNALVDAPHLSIWLLEPDGRQVTLRYGTEDGRRIAPRTRDLHDRDSHVAEAVRDKQERLFLYAKGDRRSSLIPGTRDMQSAYFAPLAAGERVLGAITIQSARADAYGERELLIFRTLAAYTAIALDNTRAYQALQQAQAQLEAASLTDPLTGLRNRRYLAAHADTDCALAARRHEQRAPGELPPDDADLVFLLLDIDHFKSVNDRYGHAAGDAVLTQMRARLEQVFRVSDHLVRWGGEEFLIVARATNRARAEELAARVCETVRATPFQLPDGTLLTKTCSLGYACYPFHLDQPRAVGWQDVVDFADVALYAAKRGGRDTWVGVHAGEVAAGAQEIKADVAGAVKRGVVRLRGGIREEVIRGVLV